MRLLLDMNLTPRWVPLLKEAGYDVVHWSSIGAPDARDDDIMQRAIVDQYIVITADLDFGAILAVRQLRTPSVIQLRGSDIRPEAIGTMLLRALDATSQALQTGALLVLEADSSRLRLLPLES